MELPLRGRYIREVGSFSNNIKTVYGGPIKSILHQGDQPQPLIKVGMMTLSWCPSLQSQPGVTQFLMFSGDCFDPILATPIAYRFE